MTWIAKCWNIERYRLNRFKSKYERRTSRESLETICGHKRGMSSTLIPSILAISRRGVSRSIPLSGVLASVVLLGSGYSALAEGGPTEDDSLTIETITMPKVIKRGMPGYPRRLLSKGEEGWVFLSFFVDTDGNPYEIHVSDASGDRAFQTAAIQAVKKTRFEPATYNGKKIDHEYRRQFTFEIVGKENLFRDSFKRRFYEVVEAISRKEKNKAESELEVLQGLRKTLHEDAMYWTAKYYFDQLWGTSSDQLVSVSRALGHDKSRRYMDSKLHQQLLWAKLNLQLQERKYVSALNTIDRFEDLDGVDEALRQQAAKYKRAIEALKSSAKIISVEGTIAQNNQWWQELIRNRFSVVDVEGNINEFDLICQRNRLRFKYEPELDYTFDGASGTCGVSVRGDPGTTFTLIQL